MFKAKIGVSMLHRLHEPFIHMAKRLNNENTKYIEILDDGSHELNKKRVNLLKEIAKSYNLEYTIHAPFADINIAAPTTSLLNASLKRLTKSLYNAHALDAKLWVFHPGARTGISQFYPGAEWRQNIKSVQKLYAQAEQFGINIAIENLPAKYWFTMSCPDDFHKFYKETELPIGIVLDIGHSNLENQTYPFFDQLANQIVHIHVSDNKGVDDDHLGIGYGTIDYNLVAKTLKKINYNKNVIIESCDHVTESLKKLETLLN
jgi:sugar phosphate isomerase/epimerase